MFTDSKFKNEVILSIVTLNEVVNILLYLA